MTDSSPDYNLIARALAGTATGEESAQLQRWIDADPEHRRTWKVLREAWRLSDGQGRGTRFDADADWQKVAARIGRARSAGAATGGAGRLLVLRPTRPAWARRAALAAAALAAVAGVSWSAWRLTHSHTARAMAEVSAPRGSATEALLPDGSRVRLGAESSIRYAAAFDGPTRLVQLRGMAYFEVAHDPARPFLVRVPNGVTTRVVGTHFMVRAYPEDPRVEVAVAEGRVALRGGGAGANEVMVAPGEVGRVGGDGVPSVERLASLDSELAWTRGVLVIENRPLSEALVELGRWYDARLKVEDPRLAARRISTTAGDVPLAEALEKVTLALNAHREQRGDTTVIVP